VEELFSDFPPLQQSVRDLYRVFGHYRLNRNMPSDGLFPTTAEDYALINKFLNELTGDDFGRYIWKAMTTLGTVEDFKHFLPRLCELAVAAADSPVDVWCLSTKLRYGNWQMWRERERSAIAAFMLALFRASLYEYLSPKRPDEVLHDLAEATDDLAPFLAAWEEDRSLSEVLHLADFITSQATALHWHGEVRLFDSKQQSAPDPQVTAWLQQESHRIALEDAFFEHSDGPYAQLLSDAIQYYDLWKERVAKKA
jgi:hypothetical protein